MNVFGPNVEETLTRDLSSDFTKRFSDDFQTFKWCSRVPSFLLITVKCCIPYAAYDMLQVLSNSYRSLKVKFGESINLKFNSVPVSFSPVQERVRIWYPQTAVCGKLSRGPNFILTYGLNFVWTNQAKLFSCFIVDQIRAGYCFGWHFELKLRFWIEIESQDHDTIWSLIWTWLGTSILN